MEQYPNLRPIQQTPEEAAENGRKGGIASGKARRRKRDLKRITEQLLEMQTRKGIAANLVNIRSLPEMKGKNVNVAEAIMLAIVSNALKGDIQAAKFIRDITGQRPADTVEMKAVFHEGKLPSILKQLEKDED